MTREEMEAEILRLLKQADWRRLELLLRIVRSVLE